MGIYYLFSDCTYRSLSMSDSFIKLVSVDLTAVNESKASCLKVMFCFSSERDLLVEEVLMNSSVEIFSKNYERS